MLKKTALASLAFALTVASAVQAGDASVGAAEFKKCKACHAIIAADGTEIVKGGKTGPNLYGVIGRKVGSADFKGYGPAITAIGATGAQWDEASLAAYIADPTAWVRAASGDPGAKSKMTFKLAKGGADVAAYLAGVQ